MQHKFDREYERSATVERLVGAPVETREQLIEEYRRRSEMAFAPGTLRNYRQIKATFRNWCEFNGFNSKPPVEPKVVAAYVDDLGGKIKSTTIETRVIYDSM